MASDVTVRSIIPLVTAELKGKCHKVVARAAERIAEDARVNIVRNGTIVTGRLLGSIETTELKPGHWIVWSPVFYAPYVEYGTHPHTETISVGYLTHRHLVTFLHPGTKPYPFMSPAVDKEKALLEYRAVEEFKT